MRVRMHMKCVLCANSARVQTCFQMLGGIRDLRRQVVGVMNLSWLITPAGRRGYLPTRPIRNALVDLADTFLTKNAALGRSS